MAGWFLFNAPLAIDRDIIGNFSISDSICFHIQENFTNVHHTNDVSEVMEWIHRKQIDLKENN